MITRLTRTAPSIEADDEQAVVVDPDLVARVSESVLDNASMYAPRGTTVRFVAYAADGRDLSLRVEDRGTWSRSGAAA